MPARPLSSSLIISHYLYEAPTLSLRSPHSLCICVATRIIVLTRGEGWGERGIEHCGDERGSDSKHCATPLLPFLSYSYVPYDCTST